MRKIAENVDLSKKVLDIDVDSPIFDEMLEKLNNEIQRCIEKVYNKDFAGGEISLKLTIEIPETFKILPKVDVETGELMNETYVYRAPKFEHKISTTLKKQYKTEGVYTDVLPMDKIIYYKGEFNLNELQERRLEEVRSCESIDKVIRRKADENIIVELQGRLICITPKGWKLNIKGYKALYADEEVEQEILNEPIDIEFAQKNAKVGDVIEACCAGETLIGRIRSVYGTRDMTLNILYDNETKCTAICRVNITRILKSA